VAGFADQVNDCPVIPPLLNIAKGQGDDFRSPQSIVREKRDDRGRRAEVFQQGFPGGAVRPLRAEPVANAPAEFAVLSLAGCWQPVLGSSSRYRPPRMPGGVL
jgi:hypothetical protein